jgi:hypothetical protein
MPRSVFVSYSHRQEEWVWDRLVPCLRAGGAEVLIDRERFAVGRGLVGQMDSVQDSADISLLVLSSDYLASDFCRHEMERAIARDPSFDRGVVVPLIRLTCDLPAAITDPNPLAADLRDDTIAEHWDQVLNACAADLGTTAPLWLEARDEARRFLERGESVNLVTASGTAWRPLVNDLKQGDLADLVLVDLDQPSVYSRRGLVAEIVTGIGGAAQVPAEPEDLAVLENVLSSLRRPCRLGLLHFDRIERYSADLVIALRYLVMESRKLVLLAQSRRPLASLLPAEHPLSEMVVQTVELPDLR